jgi:hypothetical protein
MVDQMAALTALLKGHQLVEMKADEMVDMLGEKMADSMVVYLVAHLVGRKA